MAANVSSATPPVLPPPRSETGAVGWIHANLLDSWYSGALTVVSIAIIGLALWFGLRWVIFNADWTVIASLGGRMIIGQFNTQDACPGQNCFWRPQVGLLLVTALLGMAWGYTADQAVKRIVIGVAVILALFAFLPYSLERMGWDVRLLLLANLPALAIGWALARFTPFGSATWIAIFTVVVFVVTVLLLRGVEGVPGLQRVSDAYWGGLMLNLLLAVAGIALSLPLGIALALGRRSNLPVVKLLCVAFIEIFRGVPLITLLFMSKHLAPLAFPEDFPDNELLRAGIVITLFSAAYMAENIRGGLQALNRGQAEAARALGLPSWQTTIFISLPQAIRNVIPAIVGQFISLFKDTSLVSIIGMQDVVETSRAFIGSHLEDGRVVFLDDALELILFLAVVFWIFTYGMSYLSRRVEQELGVGER